MYRKKITASALGCLLAATGPVCAEDIDLFLNPPQGVATTPNILFLLDNSANWGAAQYTHAESGLNIAKRDIIHQALYQVVTSPEFTDKVRIGLMTFASGDGGKVTSAVEQLTEPHQTELGNQIFGARIWQPNVTYSRVWQPNTTYEVGEYVVPTTPNGSYYMVPFGGGGTTGDTEPAWSAFVTDGATFKEAGTDAGYRVGDYVVPTSPNGYYYEVTTSGTAASSEPTWPGSGGSVESSFGVTYTTEAKLDDNIEKIPSYNNAPYALMMNEAYLYFKGDAPREGTEDGDHDPDAVLNGLYVSPAYDSCAENVIVLLANGEPDSGENNTAEAILDGYGGKLNSDPIPLEPKNYESNWGDEFARFMASSDVVIDDLKEGKQNITTYVVNVVDKAEINTKPEQAAATFLASMAENGGGRPYYAKTVEDLIVAIKDIINKINAASSVFASTTLPVSVNVRGTNLNQVYMGVFRPDDTALPRWVGNLKLYKLAIKEGTETLILADSNDLKAEDEKGGFIIDDAVSYWTTPSTFWDFHQDYDPSDSPDGKIVEKGAVAQNLRDATTRNVYTCTGNCGPGDALSGTPFATTNDNITPTALNAASVAERDDIINWTRGVDLKKDENGVYIDEDNDGEFDDMRVSIHGDVLHSRPAVINYNRNPANVVDGVTVQDEDDIIAFYGANDGTIRAVYGGKSDQDDGDAGDANDGDEIWAFIPEEFFGELKTLYDNDTAINNGGYKPYFADGHIGVYLHDANGDHAYKVADGDKVYLYFSMRRGGRLLYALDVSDPVNPKLLWKRSSGDTGYAEMGQTWSEPKVATLNLDLNGTGTATPTTVLIFGAGYDSAAEDPSATSQGTATMGRGIFVVDAATGDVIWQAGPTGTDSSTFEPVADMTYPIPSNVTVLDTDTNSYEDRLYVGDTGGQVWRANIGDPDPANWTVGKLATLADHSTTAGYRKFLYAPDVVYGNAFDYVLLGSGDREHPDDTTVLNRFYMLKDRSSSTPITTADLYDATANLIQDGTDAEKAAAEAALAATTNSGWYIDLASGEKVVSSAVTLAGNTFFNTNQPILNSTKSCIASLGTARNYIVSYKDARATTELNQSEGLTIGDRWGDVAGGGFPPSPVPVIVEIDGKKYQAVVSGTKVLTPPNVQLERRERVYWYRPGID